MASNIKDNLDYFHLIILEISQFCRLGDIGKDSLLHWESSINKYVQDPEKVNKLI